MSTIGEKLSLVRPAMDYELTYAAMLDECHALDEDTANSVDQGFAALVKRLTDMEHGIGIREDFVPQTTFWMVRDGSEVIGEVRLRHRLNSWLEQMGGHIGYVIRPSERRKGYGTRILEMALDEARTIGLTRALVTCDPDNIGSARIIERNGGVRDVDSQDPETGRLTLRYWIDLCD